jgi:glycosyltransferase involved in cell wall biosynthesis
LEEVFAKNKMRKIAYFSNTDFSLYNFRKELMVEMKKRGFEVFAVGSVTNKEIVEKIEKEGIKFINIPLKRGLDFLGGDLVYFLRVFFLCRKEKFFLCHNFTIKPCIFATLAQSMAGVKNIYCTITGLGYAFEKEGLLKNLVVHLYKFSLRRAERVIFENPDDKEFFIDLHIIKKEKTELIKGSGVNLEEFSLKNIDEKKLEKLIKEINYEKNKIIIILVARMLWSKGVGEFVKAAEELKQKYSNLEFLLIGPIDKENPSGISEEKIKEWQNKKWVKYLGERKDIKEILAFSDVVVLPSYYKEGIPRVLLEAGAMERPLITTNVPGCREVVKDNENGFLIQPKNSQQLAEKIEVLVRNKKLREEFGKKSRKIVEKEFNVERVVRETIELYNL